MSRSSRFTPVVLSALIMVVSLSGVVDAQRRAVPRHPTHPEQAVVLGGHVFIGGYFYDTFFGHRNAERVAPGRSVTFEFCADRAGRFVLYCSTTADDRCREMRGALIVQ